MRILSLRLAAGLLMVAGLASCESRPAAVGTPAATTTSASDSVATPVVAAAYVCPMNCEGSASDKPGKCPVCEMALQPNPAAKTTVQ